MRLLSRFSIAVMLILGAQASFAADNPLAQAAVGKIECFMPNDVNKTCMAFSSYTPNPQGTYDESDEIVLVPKPQITVKPKGESTVVDGMICQKFQASSLERAQFSIGGKTANQKQVEQINSELTSGFKAMIGKTSCMKLTANDGQFQINYIIDNQPFAGPPEFFEWLNPASGYRLQDQ